MRRRYRLGVLGILALTATSVVTPARGAAATEKSGSFQMIQHDFPQTLRPGERLMGHVTVKVVVAGEPAYTRPFAELRSLGATPRVLRLPADRMTPWKLPDEQQAGETFHVALTLNVPMDFPAGPAELSFWISRSIPEKGWQYAAFSAAGTGGSGGSAFRWKVTIQAADDGTAPATLPLVVGRVPAPPKVDGRIDDAEWQGAAPVPAFRENAQGGPARAGTRARVGYDDTALYLAFDCDEPLMEQAAAQTLPNRDPALWNNECVELFVNPQANQVSYLHFIVDLLGQRRDALGSDAFGYNPRWESAARRQRDGWQVEMAIPFASLGVPAPQTGEAWYANLCRERKAEAELSAWQPTYGGFAAPGRFGLWVFGSLKAYFERQAAPLAADAKQWPAELTEAAGAWRQELETWQAGVKGVEESAASTRYPELAAGLKRLQEDLARLRLKAARLSGQSFLVTQAWAYERFDGKESEQERPAGPIRLTLLQGEWADVALNLSNLTDAPLTLRCSLRRGQADDPIGYMRLGIPGLTTLWQQALPVAAGDGRLVYDAIAPIPAGTVQIAPGATTQVWLSVRAPEDARAGGEGALVVQPVDGTAGAPVRLPLTVTVVPRALAENPPIHTFLWNVLREEMMTEQPAWFAAHLRDLREHGVDVCMISSLRHLPRVKATADGRLAEPLDFSRLDALVDATRDLFPRYYMTLDIWEKQTLRRDLFGLPFGTPAYEKALKSWLVAVLEHLEAKGITRERLLINPYDESVGEECQLLARWIKEVDPKLQVIIDCSTPDVETARRMDALTDIWVPHYKYHFAEEMGPFFKLVKDAKKPHWCYFYSEGGADKAQDPTRHYLAKFWWAYAQGISGVCYWAQQYYGDPWYRADYRQAYDTSLVYPTEAGPIPSRRWQAWRRGWQDACLLAQARATLARAGDQAGLATLERHLADVVALPGNPQRAETARAWLREVIGRSGAQ